MATRWSRSPTSIGHVTLRYRGTAADGNMPALRLRTERLLASVDFRPPQLPTGAVLIVRKLHALSGSAPHSPAALAQSAEIEQLRTQMTTLYRTATRPVLNPVSPDATSVLFADPAEMLACLTRDLLNGRLWQQWYWQQMLRHVPHTPASALTTIWSEQAPFVPAMSGYLKLEEVRAAIALLSSSEISTIVGALNASFDLPLPMHTPAPTASTTPQPPHHRVGTGVAEWGDDRPPSDEYSPVLPPWQRWLSPLSDITLTPQAQYLLGLIITLYRAPAFARSANFMTQAVSWLNTELKKESYFENKENKLITAQPAANSTPETPEIPTAAVATQLGAATPNDVVFSAAQLFLTEGVLTGLGGVFYLIHLLKWLDLPASWTEAEMLAEYLGSWGIVELLARGLLGEMYERYVDDPIWDVLAMLDGREKPGSDIGQERDSQQGADRPRPLLWTNFRLPAKWLTRYATSSPSWIAATDGQRLYLVDEAAGYLVVDVPLGERSLDEVVAMEVDEYRVQGIQASIERVGAGEMCGGGPYTLACPDMPIHPHALWWLERVLGFVRYLLVRVLNEPASESSSLPEALLCKRGRLVAGRTHVDLYMSMEQINLSIRRAGLDCDPAWVPDLGRIVHFHFGQEI